jgi:hypothetical protein
MTTECPNDEWPICPLNSGFAIPLTVILSLSKDLFSCLAVLAATPEQRRKIRGPSTGSG